MTTSAEERKAPLSCLFCQMPKPQLGPRETRPEKGGEGSSGWPSGASAYRVDDLPFFICSRCESMDTSSKSALFPHPFRDPSKLGAEACVAGLRKGVACTCGVCTERIQFESLAKEELTQMHAAWTSLRFAVRTMYRDGLTEEGKCKRPRPDGTFRSFEIPKLRQCVKRLCSRDPHQLYTRLEVLGTQYVMEVAVNLVEILVAPERLGLPKPSEEEGPLGLEQTKKFLRDTLDAFSGFQETVRHTAAFMTELDQRHLEKFGITWKVLHHHIFDAVVYQNALVQGALKPMSAVLRIELVTSEADAGSTGLRVAASELPLGAFELAQSFRALDRLMKTSRQIWDKAAGRMQDFADKQMRLYKATLKAKQRMLKEDLEFFKLQRRLLAECVAKSTNSEPKEATEAELGDFTDTIRELLTGGRRGAPHSEESQVPCRNCESGHCPCDECTISHLITCGLVGPEEEGELGALPPAFLEELAEEEAETGLLRREKDRLLATATGEGCLRKRRDSSSSSSSCPYDDGQPSAWTQMLNDYSEKFIKSKQKKYTYADYDRIMRRLQGLPSDEEEEEAPPRPPLPPEIVAEDDQAFLRRLLRSGELVGVAGEDGQEVTPEMLDFMKEMLLEEADEAAVDAPDPAALPPFILQEIQRLNIPGPHTSLINRMVSKALTEGEAQAEFHSGKNWSAALVCTNAGPADKAQLLAAAAPAAPAAVPALTAAKPEFKTPGAPPRLAASWTESPPPDRTGVIAEARPPPSTPLPRKDSVSVATQVDGGGGGGCRDAHHHHHHHHEHEKGTCPDAEKGGRGCDCCCYCQMFGKDLKKDGGRGDTSQIRERLRAKLKSRKGDGKGSRERSPSTPRPQGEESVEALLEFIEGGPSSPRQPRVKESKAAAKRQRKRQAKTNAANTSECWESVFAPREDIENLDEADRDVENFKRMMMSGRPQVNRKKIQLNLSGFLAKSSSPK